MKTIYQDTIRIFVIYFILLFSFVYFNFVTLSAQNLPEFYNYFILSISTLLIIYFGIKLYINTLKTVISNSMVKGKKHTWKTYLYLGSLTIVSGLIVYYNLIIGIVYLIPTLMLFRKNG